jgi:hypothetical protein
MGTPCISFSKGTLSNRSMRSILKREDSQATLINFFCSMSSIHNIEKHLMNEQKECTILLQLHACNPRYLIR